MIAMQNILYYSVDYIININNNVSMYMYIR